ncbi:jg7676 [Pararge aegeria aegeria]|uniref:Jg7676 protein n=1 Tax=Pararge aegeria aegeria TaxID=348720 RepID=A0A8S4S574_9NEOP|nr:jg7676 [Pararge aegeria aegeria]
MQLSPPVLFTRVWYEAAKAIISSEERVAVSSALLLTSTAITNPPAQRGDDGQIIPLGEASSSSGLLHAIYDGRRCVELVILKDLYLLSQS